MLKNWKIRKRIQIEELPAIEAYEKDCPIYAVEEKAIESKRKAINHGVQHIQWFLLDHTITCSYCNTTIRYWKEQPDVHLSLRKITVYKDVPVGARDQRIATVKGWLAQVTYSGIDADCPKCGLAITFKKGGWGLKNPIFGFETTEYLVDSDSGYKRLRPTAGSES